MITEIAVSIIAFALVASMIVSIAFLMKTSKTFESAKKDIHNLSTEASNLIHKIDALVADLKSKTDSLDFVFRPLKSFGKGKHHRSETSETVSEIVELVSTSLTLFNKIRNVVKRREK